jgi:SecD/SecF fusion protein
MTRTLFEIWLHQGWLKDLNFLHIFKRLPHIDFMAIRYYFFAITVGLTVLGAALFIWRLPSGDPNSKNENSVLNIDFIGGTAYSGQLVQPKSITELRQALEGSDLPDLSIEQIFVGSDKAEGNKSRYFTVRTSEMDRKKVQKDINTRLGDNLKRIDMKEPKIDFIEDPQIKDPKERLAKAKASRATLEFVKPQTGEDKQVVEAGGEVDYASRAQVTKLLTDEFEKAGLNVKQFRLDPASKEDEEGRFSKMTLELSDPVLATDLKKALEATKQEFHNNPQPERLENFDKQLAANTQERALYAILASWAAILLYLWFRFGSWTFGAAAVLCLIHDLFFTLGAIAGAHYLHGTWVGNLLRIDDFKIDLPAVAALLTLVGYSVNDTIVVFDRIREVRGKNPLLTPQMINDSVNQTLSRTVLSSMTVWLVVIVLYIFGGEGVHLFAFVMVVGVIVGTYSSIYIASPLLLIFGEGAPTRTVTRAPQPVSAQG